MLQGWAGLLDALLEPVWLVEPRTLRLLAINRSASDLIGLPAEALNGLPAIELAASPEDQFFWEDVAAGVSHNIHSNTMLRGAEGQTIPVERKVSLVALPDGRKVYAVALRDLRQVHAQQSVLEQRMAEILATLESSTEGILVTGLHGEVRHLNRTFATLWGVDFDLASQPEADAIHARMARSIRHIAALPAPPETPIDAHQQVERAVLHLQDCRVLERTTVPQMSRSQAIGWVHAFRDITAQQQTLEALRLAAQVFASSPDPVFITDADFKVLQANPRCLAATGWLAHALATQRIDDLFFDVEQPWLFAAIQLSLEAQGRWIGEVWRRHEGRSMPVEVSWFLLKNEEGEVTHTVVHFKDITDRLEARHHMERLAYRDPLTGLANRTLLGQRVDYALRTAERSGGRFAILFVDLDRFKNINDSMGHAFGDRVLLEVTERMQFALRDVDTLSRMGGDEFVAFLQDADGTGAELAARRLLEAVQRPYMLDGVPFSLGCSIGIALFPEDGDTLDALITCADTAMYRVKDRGRGDFRFYQPQMNVDLLSRMKLDHAMRSALEAGLFRLHFQPQIRLADGSLSGAEALLRWTDPALGVVSPAEFIPLAEETGFIVPLGQWVMEAAVRQAAIWAQQGRPLCISVNVSALQFQQSDFVDKVAQCIKEAGLQPALLELEMTESVLVHEVQDTLHRLHALHRLGVRLAIDDFGTGYSSLAYLKKFPISKIKIDRAFITGLPADESDRAIVSATVAIAKALRLEVVAEGIETLAQRDFLSTEQCTAYQGFLCAPGLPAEAFEALAATIVPLPPIEPAIAI
jgi:diguanylate cyclase (GGDEF)-like protein/PAS domain S-box-containing protein